MYEAHVLVTVKFARKVDEQRAAQLVRLLLDAGQEDACNAPCDFRNPYRKACQDLEIVAVEIAHEEKEK